MVTNDFIFEWLRDEFSLIKSHGFHEFSKLNEEDFFYKLGDVFYPIGGDYGYFLREFGQANLFNGWGDLIDVPFMVYPVKEFRRERLNNGNVFVEFGDRGAQHVFFDERAICRGESSAVFVISKHEGREIYPDFTSWLLASYEWAKNKYSNRQWKLIVNGAKPFSDDELRIIEARNQYKWSHVGFADDGDAIFEVENNSELILPFLTVGVKDCDDSILIGSAWLNVGCVRPGEKMCIKASCYKDRIPNQKLVVFPKPDPTPESRDRYWEFG